eukprot:COSAG02_NODE_2536_length_8579_cov_4.816863_4_plen_63_part_00
MPEFDRGVNADLGTDELGGNMQKSPRPTDRMTDPIRETHSAWYPGRSGTRNGIVQLLNRPGC